jgi:molybdate transport system regulatory protein
MCAMKQHTDTDSPQPYLIRPRIYLGPDLIVGPGKIALLTAVRDTGSISAAARTLGMSYKRAWYLLDTLKKGFHQPVFVASPGGRGGGGAQLTALGDTLIASYTAITAACAAAADAQLAALAALTTLPSTPEQPS